MHICIYNMFSSFQHKTSTFVQFKKKTKEPQFAIYIYLPQARLTFGFRFFAKFKYIF